MNYSDIYGYFIEATWNAWIMSIKSVRLLCTLQLSIANGKYVLCGTFLVRIDCIVYLSQPASQPWSKRKFAFSIGHQIGMYLHCLLGFECFNWRIKKLKLRNNLNILTLFFQNDQSTINCIKVIILMIVSNAFGQCLIFPCSLHDARCTCFLVDMWCGWICYKSIDLAIFFFHFCG